MQVGQKPYRADSESVYFRAKLLKSPARPAETSAVPDIRSQSQSVPTRPHTGVPTRDIDDVDASTTQQSMILRNFAASCLPSFFFAVSIWLEESVF